MDLTDEIERSLGHGPEPAPLAPLLDAGHRALRRRRTLTTVAAIAAVAVIGVGATLVPGGRPGAAPVGVSDTSASPTPSTGDTTRIPSPRETATEPSPPEVSFGGQDVAIDSAGELRAKDDARVIERIRNPTGVEAPRYSWAAAVVVDGEETWYLLESSPSTSSTASAPARQSLPTLSMWVEQQVAAQQQADQQAGQGAGGVFPDLVRFAPDDTLEPAPGARILEQRTDVDIGPRLAGPGDAVAVAEVLSEGRRWYVVARRIAGGPPDYIPSEASVSPPTLDGFIEKLRVVYAADGTGEGLR